MAAMDVGDSEEKEFFAEAEVMDLSPIRELTFGVAVATGDPKTVKYLCTTVHGPYNFSEMVQEVADMWVKHQHHAKVIVLEKNAEMKVKCLDANTVDYIEAHFENIIFEEALANIPEDREYTCEAGVVEELDPEKQ